MTLKPGRRCLVAALVALVAILHAPTALAARSGPPACTDHEVLQGNKCVGCGNNNEPVCGNGASTAATMHDAWGKGSTLV